MEKQVELGSDTHLGEVGWPMHHLNKGTRRLHSSCPGSFLPGAVEGSPHPWKLKVQVSA